MARKQKDVFGFEELEKAFDKMLEKYEDKGDALLHAIGRQAGKRMRQVTPKGVGSKKPGTLKKSYRVKKPKKFKGDKVNVVLVSSGAPHAHLVEYGHEIYTSPKKLKHKVSRYNAIGRKVKKISHHGRVEGQFLFDKVWKEFETRFPQKAQDMIDEITKDLEV